jgi:hypothetical protein
MTNPNESVVFDFSDQISLSLSIHPWGTFMTYQQQISLSTKGHGDMHDLTEQIAVIRTRRESKPG